MSNNLGWEDFEIEEPEEGTSAEYIEGGSVEIWEPIRLKPRYFDIQEPKDGSPLPITNAGKIKNWRQIHTEGGQQTLSCCLLAVCTAIVTVIIILITKIIGF